jgi:hypothetical protein
MSKLQSLSLAVLTVFCLGACATGPKYKLVKNVSEQEVQQDNAACQNQAQMIQVADWEFKGTFMEGANIQMKRNRAFENCLVSKGYTAQAVDPSPADIAYKDQMNFLKTEADNLCAEQSLQPLFTKTTCGISKKPTMAMLTDSSKITKQQRVLFDKYTSKRNEIYDEYKAVAMSSNQKKALAYYEKYDSQVVPAYMLNLAKLYEGKITWGDFNKENMRISGLVDAIKN